MRNLHNILNLRALIIAADTQRKVNNYGANSINVTSQSSKAHTGMFAHILLKDEIVRTLNLK